VTATRFINRFGQLYKASDARIFRSMKHYNPSQT
jgi:hypothetical protein